MNKIDARKQSREQLLERRQNVVTLHLAGMSVMQIVEKSGLSWSAVNAAIKRHKEGGELKPAARGRKKGTSRLLTKQQETIIFKLICTRRPWQTGIRDHFLWTREIVLQLIQQKLAISLSPRCIAFYLERWGLVAKKRKKSPATRCDLAIRKWLMEHYVELDRRANTERAVIYWASKAGASISDIEPEPNIKCEGDAPIWKPKKRWVLAATNNQGKIYWLSIKGSYTEQRQIIFLNALVQDNRKKVFLIRENLTAYRRKDVLDWLRENRDRIELFPDPVSILPK